jgi:hypothetical protein
MKRLFLLSLALILGLSLTPAVVADDFVSDPEVPILQNLELTDRDPHAPLTLVVEMHSVAPAQNLLVLEQESEVTVEIESGPARFLYGPEAGGELKSLTRVSYRSAQVRLPALVISADKYYDSHIFVFVDGSPLGLPLRVTAIAAGLFELYGELPSFAPAILRLDLERGYAIIDEAQVNFDAILHDYSQSSKFQELTKGPRGISESRLEPESEGDREVPGPRLPDGEPGIVWCPWLTAPSTLPSDFSNDDCNINLDPRGRVSWQFTNPRAEGFSYKDEHIDSPLFSPAYPANSGIDGIYRSQWGCGVALKVPNNCHLIGKSPQKARCCRGPFAQLFGKICQFIVPGVGAAANWPSCPLP